MPAGDPQRTWFPEMIQKLRAEWHAGMSLPELVRLRDSLDSMLTEIRCTRKIRSPIFRCPQCGHMGPQAEPRVSVRAMILSLARFNIADLEHVKVLERQWALYRETNQLDLYGKPVAGESPSNDCAHSNVGRLIRAISE
jgi:hypothetical protein